MNSLNQYITNNDGTTTKTLAYDRNGNLTSDGTNSFCYSSENLLKGMNGTCAAPSVSLAYDPLARLSQVTGTSTTRFGYDGSD